MDARRFAPATTRNREPILEVLRRVCPARARVLEIAAGTGEHAVFLSSALGVISWQPTDADAEALASIDAWRAHDGSSRVLPAMRLDVTEGPWPEGPFDLITCVNMIHISPWASCEALFDGAARALAPGGIVYLYGPYKREGRHTAESNARFDESLRARDPRWGVRALEDVARRATQAGFTLRETVEMPANNLSVVFGL